MAPSFNHGAEEFILLPESSELMRRDDLGQAARQLARERHALLEKDRLIRHQRIALDLTTLAPDQRDRLIKDARAMVSRWRVERLCSADYIQRWEQILGMEPEEMALAIVSEADGWGPALRQNSPWVGVHA